MADGWAIESGQYQRSTGGRLPEWYLRRPMPRPGDAFWLRAYSLLNTERQISREFSCPIPWSKIAEYADREGLTGSYANVFVDVIILLDRRHREWHREQQDAEAKKEERRQRRAERAASAKRRG